ncbi:hypothetical protein [uncultured Flavobacterium sp.]|uniref:hypothetical protein n=1 Tax=uncultured Flavobacterium sp. TaxID=165435 RepID=UPI0025933EE5|nr:hypothetical protein [uncultured Flavobacterium sp.]
MDGTYINGYLNEIMEDYLKSMDSFILVAKIIALIGLIVSAYFSFFQMMDGSNNNEALSKFLKKFMLTFLGVFYYSTFIYVINVPLNAITEASRAVAIQDVKDQYQVSRVRTKEWMGMEEEDPEIKSEVARLVAEANAERGTQKKNNDEQSITDSVLSTLTEAGNVITNAFTELFTDILLLISELALIILNIIRGFYLIVLTLFGIFVMAISTFPSLEGSFSQWLMKYINVYLWLPIGFIFQGILAKIELMNQLRPLDEYEAGISTFSILISVCTIIGFLTIPSISSWMVNASTSSISGKMEQKGQKAASELAKAGKAMMGV